MGNYQNRLDAVEATLAQRTQTRRIIPVLVYEGDDEEEAIAAAKRTEGIAPDDEAVDVVIIQFVSPTAKGASICRTTRHD